MDRTPSKKHVAMAGGYPIDSQIADQAADWLTLVMSDEMTQDAWTRLQTWRQTSPDHERAWSHIEAVTGRFRVMDAGASYKTLSPYADLGSPARRKLLGLLIWGGAIGVAGSFASRTQEWRTAVADLRTETGEQRSFTLPDGTRILLNTASAIDIEFSDRVRLVRLLTGEISIMTGHTTASAELPFVVETTQGRIRALGTRFTVRQEADTTVVAVEESAVQITPIDAPQSRATLYQHQRASFTHNSIGETLTLNDQDVAWTRGQIIADNIRLADFLDELARYRPGIVRCDSVAALLRFSGVFPLHDTDAILNTLPTVLPVSVRQFTRYWVSVDALRDERKL